MLPGYSTTSHAGRKLFPCYLRFILRVTLSGSVNRVQLEDVTRDSDTVAESLDSVNRFIGFFELR